LAPELVFLAGLGAGWPWGWLAWTPGERAVTSEASWRARRALFVNVLFGHNGKVHKKPRKKAAPVAAPPTPPALYLHKLL